MKNPIRTTIAFRSEKLDFLEIFANRDISGVCEVMEAGHPSCSPIEAGLRITAGNKADDFWGNEMINCEFLIG